MTTPIVLRIALPTPLRRTFDYLSPDNSKTPSPGSRVRVPFQQRELIGVLLETTNHSELPYHKLKKAIEFLDESPIMSAEILQLCLWAASYYHYPVGEVIDSALPTLLRQGKPAEYHAEPYWRLTEQGQQVDVTTIKRAARQIELLKWLGQQAQGVTSKQIKEHGFASTLITALSKKNWVEKISAHLPCHPEHPSCHPEHPSCHPERSEGSGDLSKTNSQILHFVQDDKGRVQSLLKEAPLVLNAAQQHALSAINATEKFDTFLLDGITGSGKTEVYLQAIESFLQQQKQVLILVPEIGLTPQTIQRFRQRFTVPIVALHSGLSDKERLNAWLSAKSGDAKMVIGTRSAVFSPFANLGLIIVDEEHDISFKQQEGFRYHARDVAVMRAHSQNIPIVLGSATPSLETLSKAQQGRYQHLRLPHRAGNAQLPQFAILDIRNAKLEEGLSTALLSAIKQHLEHDDNQVMLFLNRRGFAPVLMCHACGWTSTCKRCDARMTYHHQPRRLHCHHCDSRRPVLQKCEDCGTHDLQIIGLGTERLEQVLQLHFPNMSIARIDRDSTQRKGSMENLLKQIHRGEHRILIGTQMLAKGHHFPHVTLVGIVDADSGFFSADFRAIERMGQLILQVAGRAGRMEKTGTVIIQTRHPDNPLLQQLLREDYHRFASALLQEREQAMLPPHAFLALFRAEAHHVEQAMQFLQQVKRLADSLGEDIPAWGPVPAPMPRRAGRYRMQLLLQAKQRPLLQQHLKKLLVEVEKLSSKQKVRWSVDVDPVEMF